MSLLKIMIKIMKNKTLVISFILILITIFVVINLNENNKEDETIKVGAVFSLTGPLASYGNEYEKGLILAAEEINASGGINGKMIELIIEDDSADPKRTVSATQKLLNTDNVKYLITALSSPSFAVTPITKELDVIHFSLTTTKLGNEGDNIFRDYWDMYNQGFAIGEAIKKERMESLGIMALNWADYVDFNQGLVDSLGEDFPIIEERYNFSDSDFRSQLSKIKEFDPDGILVYGFPGSEVISITNQIDQIGLSDKRLFSGETVFGFNFVYEEVGDILEKMNTIDGWYSLDTNNQKAKDFISAYESNFGESLNGDAAYSYDVLYTIAKAIEKAENPYDIEVIKQNILETDMQGAGGRIYFDEYGNSVREAYLQEYRDGSWYKYEL